MKGVAHPHPFPNQLRLTEHSGQEGCTDHQSCGLWSKTSFAEETGALSLTAKTRISPKLLSLWGRGTEGQLHSLARARGTGKRGDSG